MGTVWVAIGPSGATSVVAPVSELAWIAEKHPVDDVIAHGFFTFCGAVPEPIRTAAGARRSLPDAIRTALDAVGASGHVILDDGGRPSVIRDLCEALAPRTVVVDAGLWRDARAVKDDDEIEALRRVNAAAEAGIVHALERADVGSTELDLLRWTRQGMAEQGARPVLSSIGIGERGALVDMAPTERRLALDDVMRFDVGCVLDGYQADLARTAVIGDAPAWLQETHDALVAGEEAALQAMRPGATGADLFDRAVAAVRAGGVHDYERSHCGHGIGLELYEPPLIAPGSDRPVEAGMTCCVETPLYVLGTAGLQIEDAIVVTDGGYERLGSLPRRLLGVGDAI
jgi:Xaa-Pro aminopeptidase